MNCPSCAAELPSSARFCGSCGHQFQTAKPASAISATSGRSIESIVNDPPAFPDVGALLSEAWPLAKPHIGIMFVGGLAMTAAAVLLSITVVGALALPALGAGFVIVSLRVVNGAEVSLGNFFDGFKLLVPLVLLGIVQGFLTTLGMYALVLPGLYLGVVWIFSQFLVIDRGLDFWPALEASRKVVHKNFWSVAVFLFVLGMINVLGAVPCYLGLIATGPLSVVAMALAYKALFGVVGGAERL